MRSMGKKTNPFIHYPAWTEARFWTFVRSALRSAWNRYPVKFEVLKEAYVCTKENVKTGKQAKHYRCNECKELFPAKEVLGKDRSSTYHYEKLFNIYMQQDKQFKKLYDEAKEIFSNKG